MSAIVKNIKINIYMYIRFVTIIESVYSLPLLIHIGLTVLILSILGYQVSFDKNSHMTITILGYIFTSCIQIILLIKYLVKLIILTIFY